MSSDTLWPSIESECNTNQAKSEIRTKISSRIFQRNQIIPFETTAIIIYVQSNFVGWFTHVYELSMLHSSWLVLAECVN